MNLLRVIAVFAPCLLTSCIDCHEEIWLQPDGSGRADISYTLPAAAAKLQGGEDGVRKLVERFLAKTEGIRSPMCEVTREGDRLQIRVRADFDSANDLTEISSGGPVKELPSAATNLAGKFEVFVSGRTVDFTRTISPGAALPGAGFMPSSTFEGRRLVYITHLPVVANESNATRTENGGRTLVWDFPLATAIKSPVTTHFKADFPIPKSLMIATALAVLIAGWVAFLGFLRLRTGRSGKDGETLSH